MGAASLRHSCLKRMQQQRTAADAEAAVAAEQTPLDDYEWTASDDFEELGDRRDLPPMALPAISGPQVVVLMRHGQSTWNKVKRIQGSSNVSVLSEKGVRQAEAARDKVRLVKRSASDQGASARAILAFRQHRCVQSVASFK